MQHADPPAESATREYPLEFGSVCIGPVNLGFYDWSWRTAIIVIAGLTGDMWPRSPAAISAILAIIVLLVYAGPCVPNVCEATPAGLYVRSIALSLRFSIMRVPWVQLARYYWRQDARGWRLVFKVCRRKPGQVDHTFTWQFPWMTPSEHDRLDAVLRTHCEPEQTP